MQSYEHINIYWPRHVDDLTRGYLQASVREGSVDDALVAASFETIFANGGQFGQYNVRNACMMMMWWAAVQVMYPPRQRRGVCIIKRSPLYVLCRNTYCTLGSLLRLMHFFSSCNFMRCGRSTQMYSAHLPLHISLKSIQMCRLY